MYIQQNYQADIDNIIALCHILDDFKNFDKNVLSFLPKRHNKNFLYNLTEISGGNRKIGTKKEKKFYLANKSIIDIINKYSNVAKFISYNYHYNGQIKGDYHFFHDYIKKHINQKKQILSVLEKIKELGFYTIEFNEKLDFTKDVYKVSSIFYCGSEIVFVANPQVIPTYNDIKYITEDSNYRMFLYVNKKGSIPRFFRKIELNSLLFDANTLPKKLDQETIYNPLLNQKNIQKEKISSLKNSVDLSVSVSDLQKQFDNTNEIVKKLEGVGNKEELKKILLNIKQNIEKLEDLSEKYDKEISQEYPILTPNLLEQEKELYLKRKSFNYFDYC